MSFACKPEHPDGRMLLKVELTLGCGPEISTAVLSLMKEDRLWFLVNRQAVFNAVAWTAFAKVRRAMIAVGGDDPLWDLRISAAIETGGVS
jgi:hypothetical protein